MSGFGHDLSSTPSGRVKTCEIDDLYNTSSYISFSEAQGFDKVGNMEANMEPLGASGSHGQVFASKVLQKEGFAEIGLVIISGMMLRGLTVGFYCLGRKLEH